VTTKELKQVHFLHDSSEILPDSQSLVEEIAEALRTRPEIGAVEIQGHTDNSGTPEHNQALSERRAEAVRSALTLLGIEPNRLVARGYGQQQPLVPNTNVANKAKNRRVQLMIQAP
jgi:outer membrane protein OmpA-like peptidoglycan-associated protein